MALQDESSPSILKNPFHLLGASVRDTRQKVMALEEEKSLFLDHEICSKARADLTNPRTRLACEIAWLPGVSPKQSSRLLQTLETNPKSLKTEDVSSLAYANLLAASLESLDAEDSVDVWTDDICHLGKAIDIIDEDEVQKLINEDRVISGFPEIKTVENIRSELEEHRKALKGAVLASLNRLPTLKMVTVLTKVVEKASDHGNVGSPLLIDELIDSYEIYTHSLLMKEVENVQLLIEKANEVAPNGEAVTATVIEKLGSILNNWHKFVLPIQVSMKSRGLPHEISHDLAEKIRSLGIDLYNKYDYLKLSNKLIKLTIDFFNEVVEVTETASSDLKILQGIEKEREDKAKLVNEIKASKVYQVLISAHTINYSKICTCCLSTENLKEDKLEHSWQESGYFTKTNYKRSFSFLICGECLKHRSEYNKKRLIVVICAALLSTATCYLFLELHKDEWFIMAIISSILTLISVFFVSTKFSLTKLPDNHACRTESVELSNATSKTAMVFQFHNPIYAMSFADANKEVVVTIDRKKPTRGEKIFAGKGRFSLCAWAVLLGVVLMSFLRN